jgi:hypothetical protein
VIKDIPKMVQTIDNTTVSYTSSPAGTIRSGCTISSGRLIDRTLLGRGYNAVVPFLIANGNQSTSLDAKVTLGVHLYHGDSSDGGDLAEYSTHNRPDDAVFMSSAMTTSYTNWTTGDKHCQSNSKVYDLRGANRYIALGARPTINTNATSTTASGNLLNIAGGLAFVIGDEDPQRAPVADPYSTSTST